jgi:hypothetical protein
MGWKSQCKRNYKEVPLNPIIQSGTLYIRHANTSFMTIVQFESRNPAT